MYAVLRPRGQSACLRWHSYGFQEPEDVVEAALNGYLNNLVAVRQFDFEVFKGWQNGRWRAAGYNDVNTEIARQLVRTCMWEDREFPVGCKDFVDMHYDGGMPAIRPDALRPGSKAPYLIHPAE